MITRIASIGALLVAVVVVGLFGMSQSSTATGGQDKITVCHATGSSSNPYSKVNVPKKEIAGGYGHGAHSGDAWLPFVYNGHAYAGQGSAALVRNNCSTTTASPSPSTSPTACPTTARHTTASPCPTPTATATPTTLPTTPPATPNACPPRNLLNAIRGTGKNDTLTGTACRDGMLGHKGNDTIFGLGESDVILGGLGNDRADGGTGRDALRGGPGRDTLVSNDQAPGDRLIGGLGKDLCIIDPGDKTKSCERIITR